LRGWQLQQAGVGVGRGPGPLRNAGIGSPGCGHPDKAGPAARVSSARPNVACPACIARSASRSGPAADWHAGKVAASGRSIRPTRLTQGGPRYSQKHRGDLTSAAPEFRLVQHLLWVRLAHPTPTVIARNVSCGSMRTQLSPERMSAVEGKERTSTRIWRLHRERRRLPNKQASDRPKPIYASIKSNASCQRTTRAVEGEGKCAVHISVDVSQKRPNNSRLELPACAES
jgi:hypothetical protein